MSRVVVAVFLFASTLFAQNVDAALLRHFEYDQKAPLDVEEAGVEQRGDVAIHDISYASPKADACRRIWSSPAARDPLLL